MLSLALPRTRVRTHAGRHPRSPKFRDALNRFAKRLKKGGKCACAILKSCAYCLTRTSLGLRPSRDSRTKEGRYLTSAVLVVLSQHVNVNCVMRPDTISVLYQFALSISGLPVRVCACCAGTTFMSHDSFTPNIPRRTLDTNPLSCGSHVSLWGRDYLKVTII